MCDSSSGVRGSRDLWFFAARAAGLHKFLKNLVECCGVVSIRILSFRGRNFQLKAKMSTKFQHVKFTRTTLGSVDFSFSMLTIVWMGMKIVVSKHS